MTQLAGFQKKQHSIVQHCQKTGNRQKKEMHILCVYIMQDIIKAWKKQFDMQRQELQMIQQK